MISSVDGFISTESGAVNPMAQWDEEVQRFYLDLFTSSGGIVFGRNLYEQYVGHWSKVAAGTLPAESELEFAWTQRMMKMDKYVISNSLSNLSDNTGVISGDLAVKIEALKHMEGGDLLLHCGPALFARLNGQGLIDQYMLYVCPNALGHGNHLFRDIVDPISLVPEHVVKFSSGMELRYYRPMANNQNPD